MPKTKDRFAAVILLLSIAALSRWCVGPSPALVDWHLCTIEGLGPGATREQLEAKMGPAEVEHCESPDSGSYQLTFRKPFADVHYNFDGKYLHLDGAVLEYRGQLVAKRGFFYGAPEESEAPELIVTSIGGIWRLLGKGESIEEPHDERGSVLYANRNWLGQKCGRNELRVKASCHMDDYCAYAQNRISFFEWSWPVPDRPTLKR